MRLLLVEDGAFSRRVIGGIFNRIGVKVDYVANEREAMRSSHLNYDIVVISSNMEHSEIVDYLRKNETDRNFIVLMNSCNQKGYQYVSGVDVICNRPLNEKEAKLILDAKEKYGKSFYSKASISSFKEMCAANSSNDSCWGLSQR